MVGGGDCDPPTALVTTAQGDTIRACPGDTVLLDGSASYPAAGHIIQQWIWDLGNGMFDTTTTAFHSVALPEGGYFVFGLQVIDEVGCVSLQEARVTAFVSRRPSFTGTLAPDTICPEATVALIGLAYQRSLVLPPAFNAVPPLEIPDDFEQIYFPLVITEAAPSDTISDPDQLGDICISMEHSFMGDLVIQLSCPNGNAVVLHQQGGGGTFLGEAYDFDTHADPVPGTCLNYCFNTHPDYGTWVACAQSGATPNVIPFGTLAPGSYTPVQSLSGLVGCPVNGEWTLSIFDFWAADNGFLCSWSIGLNAFLPDSINQYGPVLGASSTDSSFWSGGGILNDPIHAGLASFSPPGSGEQQLTFTVMDSYGCIYDTIVTVVVPESAPPIVETDGGQGGLCATNAFPATYTWYFNGSPTGITGNCWTPPGPGLVTIVGTNAFGCTDTTVILATTVGRLDQSTPELTAYPDGDGGLWAEANGMTSATVRLRILDMAGRLLWERPVHPSGGRLKEHFSGSLASGTYILQLVDNGKVTALHMAMP